MTLTGLRYVEHVKYEICWRPIVKLKPFMKIALDSNTIRIPSPTYRNYFVGAKQVVHAFGFAQLHNDPFSYYPQIEKTPSLPLEFPSNLDIFTIVIDASCHTKNREQSLPVWPSLVLPILVKIMRAYEVQY